MNTGQDPFRRAARRGRPGVAFPDRTIRGGKLTRVGTARQTRCPAGRWRRGERTRFQPEPHSVPESDRRAGFLPGGWCMCARVAMVLAFLAVEVSAVSPAAAQSPQWLIEGRGGVSVATGGYGDSQKTGYDLGAGAGYLLSRHRWAESGQLPAYGELNSSQRFAGMSMAYLMGSADLEWLGDGGRTGALRTLWARL